MTAATVYVIDASPYVFRAFFSLPESIAAPDGRPMNAAYGFASFLVKLAGEESPTHLAVAFDESLTTSFRNDLYPAYKAQREEPPAGLVAQLPACRELAEALGARCFVDPEARYEADDLIATLVAGLAADGHRAVVVTSDKDLAQLVGPAVELWDYGRDERLGAAGVRERFGVEPAQIADYLGLRGDPVDNIPGVPGVGPKTAAALLAAFPDLDEIYSRLDEVPRLPVRGAEALAGRLAEHREQAMLSRELATVARDAPGLRVGLEELAYEGADPALVDPLFERLGFGGIRDRIPRWKGSP